MPRHGGCRGADSSRIMGKSAPRRLPWSGFPENCPGISGAIGLPWVCCWEENPPGFAHPGANYSRIIGKSAPRRLPWSGFPELGRKMHKLKIAVEWIPRDLSGNLHHGSCREADSSGIAGKSLPRRLPWSGFLENCREICTTAVAVERIPREL